MICTQAVASYAAAVMLCVLKSEQGVIVVLKHGLAVRELAAAMLKVSSSSELRTRLEVRMQHAMLGLFV